jgi:hypothetical protein
MWRMIGKRFAWIAIAISLSVGGCSDSPKKMAAIVQGSSTDQAVQLFVGASGANLVAQVNYDYSDGTQTVDYVFPHNSALAAEAQIYLGKTYKTADYSEIYNGHLNRHACFYRRSLLNPVPQGLSYRVSWAFYDPGSNRPKGYLVALFPYELPDEDSQGVCTVLERLAEKIKP